MRWIGLAGVTLALAFAVVGCGGSNDAGSEAASDTAVTEPVVSTDTVASTEETATDGTATDTTPTDTNSTTAGLTEDCKDLADASQKFSAAFADSSGNDTSGLEATVSAYEEMAKQAPDELKDDFEALGKVMSEYAAAIDDLDLKPGDTPNAAQIAKLVKLGQSLSTQDVTKASAAIAAWSTANCSPTP